MNSSKSIVRLDGEMNDDDVAGNEGKDLNLSEDEYKVKNQIKNGEILYEYYNEFFEDDDEDYEEEDLNAQLEDKNQHIFANKPTRPSIRKETIPSRSIPSYFGNLSTSHLLLMGASALISFILFTIAFVVCCHQKQQKKKVSYLILMDFGFFVDVKFQFYKI